MGGEKEGEERPQEPTHQDRAIQNAPRSSRTGENPQDPSLEQDAFSAEFWEHFIERANISPPGEDPAYWPTKMFLEFNDLLLNREYIRDKEKRAFAEKLAALQETINNVDAAYKITAYLQCKQPHLQKSIAFSLELDREGHGRDQVTLTDAEMEILRRLCKTPRYALTIDETRRNKEPVAMPLPQIPFNPEKRVYRYAEVPIAPDMNPLGKRHLTTQEIRRRIAREQAKQK